MHVAFGYNTNGRFPRIEKLRFRVDLPSSFGELKQRDLEFLGAHWPYPNDVKFHAAFFLHLCNFKQRFWFRLFNFFLFKNDPDFIYTIISNQGKEIDQWTFNFLFNDPVTEQTIISDINLKGKKYVAFSAGLRNISMEEFAEAEKYLEHIILNKNLDALENLVAVLYKPEHSEFEINACHNRAVLFEQLPKALKIGIYIQYRAQRQFMIDANKAFFRKAKKNTSSKHTWKDIIDDLADKVVDLQLVKKTPAWETFRWVASSNRKAEEMEAKYKSKNK